jgi:LysR family transcriptional regulator, carnitine catabolism transcriptional activator
MNINLRQLRAFVSIGRLGSFTKAAEALHATQPALSAQIRDLEDALGVKLFDRNTRSVSLTQAGEDLMPSVDTVLSDLTSVVTRARDVARRNTGRVTVAALPSLAATLMPKVIARMRDEHPGIVVVIKDALAERAVALLRADEADLALASAPPPDRELSFTPLFADRMVAVLPPAHPLARTKTMRLADLLDTPLVLMDRDSSVRRIVDGACASIGRLAAPAYEAAFMATAIGLVRAGLGATILPSSASELLAAGDLVIRALDAPRIERELGVVKQRRRAYSPAAETLVAMLKAIATPPAARSRASAAAPRPASPSKTRRSRARRR